MDDSVTQQILLKHILQTDPEITVVGTASDGEEAVKKVESLLPDIVTMDIHMPKMNGIEATRRIMEKHPLPIVIVSSSCIEKETMDAFDAFEAGALTILDRINYTKDQAKEIVQTIKLMSEIKVVRRYPHLKKNPTKHTQLPNKNPKKTIRLIAIGVSTGGPIVLQSIFTKLNNKHAPILVVQHISADFLAGLVEWLKLTTHRQIKVAEHEEALLPNWIYFAPSNHQMGLKSPQQILLCKDKSESVHVPSVSFLFRSIASIDPEHALGILLTGMGRDGADGLKLMRDRGSRTIAQDETSSIIFGMPKEAIALGAAELQLNPDAIAAFINGIEYEPKN